jgi:acyl-CoA reductase-like NAD-dependent aldehyde dehydrogenase
MLELPAFHLPGELPPPQTVAEHDGVRAVAPALDPFHIDSICQRLSTAQRTLRGMPAARIITAIDRAACTLMREGCAQRAALLQALEALTGYSPAMARLVLDRMAADWTRPALEALLTAEFGALDALDRPLQRAPGVSAVIVPPRLGFHIFAGNVPGVAVTSIVRSLLVRSAVFGKSAAGEMLLAPTFARLLAEADPDVGACVAVTWWAGGDTEREAAVMRHAGIVVHYGGAEAIASLRSRAPATVPFVDHGPRLSFALLGPAALAGDALDDAASDVALATAVFDQQGCVSPQLLYVLGPADAARQVAAALAHAFGNLAGSLPRGRIDAAEAAAIRELRSRTEFRAIAGDDVELWAGPALEWTVIFDSDPALAGSCLNRTLLVKPLPSLDLLAGLTAPVRHLLQTVGIAGFEDAAELRQHLTEMGATRVAPIQSMPWPPPTWHHDGRGPLTELVGWADLEV